MTRGKLFWRTTFSRNYQYGSFFSKQRVKQNWRSWRCNSNFQPLQLLNTASKSWKYPQLAEMFQHLCCVEWPLKNLAMLDSKGALKKVLSKYQEILLDFNLNLNEKCHNLQPLQFPSMSGYSCFWELSLFTFPSDILPPGPRSMSGEQLTGGPRKTKMGCGQNTEECRRPKLKATARNSGKDSTRWGRRTVWAFQASLMEGLSAIPFADKGVNLMHWYVHCVAH